MATQRQRKQLRFAASEKKKKQKRRQGQACKMEMEIWYRGCLGAMVSETKTSGLKKRSGKKRKTEGKCVKCRKRQLAISQFGTFGIFLRYTLFSLLLLLSFAWQNKCTHRFQGVRPWWDPPPSRIVFSLLVNCEKSTNGNCSDFLLMLHMFWAARWPRVDPPYATATASPFYKLYLVNYRQCGRGSSPTRPLVTCEFLCLVKQN